MGASTVSGVEAHLTVLDVGHGNAAVLAGPAGTVLIDSGPGPWTQRYLVAEGVSHLAGVAITHADEDHLAGLSGLIDSGEFSFGEVRVNSDADKSTRMWDNVTFSLDQLAVGDDIDFKIQLCAGDVLPSVATGVSSEVVAPSRYLASRGAGSTDRLGQPLTANSVSAVVRISANGQPRVLLAADLDAVGLANVPSAVDLRAPVLVFPHHGGHAHAGGGTAANAVFATELCRRVEPQMVIFSLGRGRHRTPRPEIVRAIRASGAAVRIACTQLSEHCASANPPAAAFEHLTALRARGWETQSCCAGTLRIPLAGSPVVPDEAAHEAFKADWARNALCR